MMDAGTVADPGSVSQASFEASLFNQGHEVGKAAGQLAERADTLAYLHRKHTSATKLAENWPHEADHARAMMRVCEILSDDLRAGLHEGEAMIWPEALQIEADSDNDARIFTRIELVQLAAASVLMACAGFALARWVVAS